MLKSGGPSQGSDEEFKGRERGLRQVFPCCIEGGVFCTAAWKGIGVILGLPLRQIQVAKCILAGEGDEEIAHALGLSWSTIRTYVRRLYARLRVSSQIRLATRVFAAYLVWRSESSPPQGCPQMRDLNPLKGSVHWTRIRKRSQRTGGVESFSDGNGNYRAK